MELILDIFDFFINLDQNLTEMVKEYGVWTYLFMFGVIFCETGLVVAPFLPGDSMLFVIGALCSSGELDLAAISLILVLAAVLGDTVNYHVGKTMGPRIFKKDNVRFLKKEYLLRTHEFYVKHGGKTILLARFIPVIRTFAPFVAGMGNMSYGRFISYNFTGAVAWVALFLAGGYFFGNIPAVEDNFVIVIFAIIFISFMPGVVAYIRDKRIRAVEEEDL